MIGRALGLWLALVLWAGWCGPGSAAAIAGISSEPGDVLSGGIGEQEQQMLAAREREFNLKLVFSLTQGNYLADVDISVSDAKGLVVVRQSDTGPWVLARLPGGNYSVTATHRGKILTRTVKIDPRRLRTEYLRWLADPEQDLPVSRWLDRD